MRPTEILIAEHHLIKQMLGVLNAICDRLNIGKDVKVKDLDEIIDFIRNYADAWHHAKEEDILLTAMKSENIPDNDDLAGQIAAEHTLGRGFVDSMEYEIDLMKTGTNILETDFKDFALSYLMLISHHICREDFVLFPMLDESISDDLQQSMVNSFKQIEIERFPAGTEKKYKLLIEYLIDQYGCNMEGLDMPLSNSNL